MAELSRSSGIPVIAGSCRPSQPGVRWLPAHQPARSLNAGREAFAAWLDREPGPEKIRYPLLLTMAFGGHLAPGHLAPGRLAAFVAAHRTAHAARLEGYETLRAEAGGGLDAFAGATLDFGIRYERAVLDWFDHLSPEVGGDDAGVRR